MAADPDVEAVATVGRTQAPLDDIVVPFYAIQASAGKPFAFVTLDGRAPEHPGEVVLGPDTAHVIGARIGDRIAVGDGQHLRVVGLGLLPTTPHSSFDQGAWILPADVTRAIPTSVRRTLSTAFEVDLTDDATFATAFFLRGFVGADLRQGADLADVYRRIGAKVDETVLLSPPSPSADQASMHNVRTLPLLFGVFAPLIALAALLHVSSSVLRRRGTDLAVLRVLGLTPRQAGACIAWQSTVLATIGIVVGAPLGFVVGRTTWRIVAERTPMLAVIPTWTLSLALLVPLVIVAANLAGAPPAWRISRSSPGETLRAD
jgi:hypothetical protein